MDGLFSCRYVMACESQWRKGNGKEWAVMLTEVLLYYDYPTVMTASWTSFFSAFCRCWVLLFLDLHDIHCFSSKCLPTEDPLFSLLWLQDIPLIPRYKSLDMLGLLCSITYLGSVKNKFSLSQRKNGLCISSFMGRGEEWKRSITEKDILVACILDVAIAQW